MEDGAEFVVAVRTFVEDAQPQIELGEGPEPGGESGSGPLDPDALKNYLQNLDPEDFGKFTP